MKFVAEFRDQTLVEKLVRQIHQTTTRNWKIMEVCGGQTHSILKYGLSDLLPKQIELLHGPGCPICVTPTEWIDKAIEIALTPNTVFASFGDMLRVPGTKADLLSAKASGADVRVVYSPLDSIQIAKENPTKEVIFFGVGFETTAPGTALLVQQARSLKIENLSVLLCHVLVPPALIALLSSPSHRIDGFLATGHVCTVMGVEAYRPIAEKYRVPIVVAGFEPVDILDGILACILQLEKGQATVQNSYKRVVKNCGNEKATHLLSEVFSPVTRPWRGMGEIPNSGLGFTREYSQFDAESKFGRVQVAQGSNSECISGLILQGLKKPPECKAFNTKCKPEHPLGATMVSTEGACSAYYRYQLHA